ncbi:cell division protein [Brevundimonas sp.]|uniref:cell division protein FtsL n=1 Tax=Brevundimonas sp. TaxID=1871086 RepID=UPI001DFA16A3|nr:cell division protein [Brevundimonas sp.]MBA4000757.1 cell division protein [Brevundimonas sp.]
MTAVLRSVFDWKIRGFRVTEIVGVAILAAVVVSVYFVKAQAARQSAEIAALQRDISDERQRMRLLIAETARLEEPGRLEALSRQAGLAPISVEQRIDLDSLPELAPVQGTPAPAAVDAEASQ